MRSSQVGQHSPPLVRELLTDLTPLPELGAQPLWAWDRSGEPIGPGHRCGSLQLSPFSAAVFFHRGRLE